MHREGCIPRCQPNTTHRPRNQTWRGERGSESRCRQQCEAERREGSGSAQAQSWVRDCSDGASRPGGCRGSAGCSCPPPAVLPQRRGQVAPRPGRRARGSGPEAEGTGGEEGNRGLCEAPGTPLRQSRGRRCPVLKTKVEFAQSEPAS